MMYKEDSDNFLIAISLSLFSFVFLFFGLKISLWYLLVGFVFLVFSIRYWIKLRDVSGYHSEYQLVG